MLVSFLPGGTRGVVNQRVSSPKRECLRGHGQAERDLGEGLGAGSDVPHRGAEVVVPGLHMMSRRGTSASPMWVAAPDTHPANEVLGAVHPPGGQPTGGVQVDVDRLGHGGEVGGRRWQALDVASSTAQVEGGMGRELCPLFRDVADIRVCPEALCRVLAATTKGMRYRAGDGLSGIGRCAVRRSPACHSLTCLRPEP